MLFQAQKVYFSANKLVTFSPTQLYYNETDNQLLLLSADAESRMFRVDIYEDDVKLYTMLSNTKTLKEMYSTGKWSHIGVL